MIRLPKPSRFFSKFLLSFLVIIIFAIISGYVTFRLFVTKLEQNVMQVNYSSLEQMSGQFDGMVSEVNNLFNQLSMDRTVNSSITEDSSLKNISYKTIFKVYNHMSSLKNESIEDLFIYYKTSDRIVSVYNAAFHSEQYFKTYYQNDNSCQTFVDLIDTPSYNQISSFGSQQYRFIMTQTMPVGTLKDWNAMIFFVPNRSRIRSLLDLSTWSGGATLVYDRNNNLIVSNNADMQIDISQYEDTTNFHSDTIMDEKVIILIKVSNNTGLKYISIVPTAIFWDDMTYPRLMSIIVFSFFSVLSLALSLFLAKYNYRPISNIVQYLSTISNVKPKKSENEIDFMWTELRKYSIEYRKNTDIMKDDFIENALQGISPSTKGIKDIFHSYDMPITTDIFSVLLFKVEDWDRSIIQDIYEGSDVPLIEVIMKNVLPELCLPDHKGYVVSFERDLYACLINLPDSSQEHPKKVGSQMLQFLQKEMGVICTASFGGCYTDWKGVDKSYNEARDALQYSVIVGIGELLSPAVIKNDVFSYNFESRNLAEMLLLSYLKTGESSPEDILSQVKRAYFGREIMLPEEYKCYFYDMNDLLHKTSYTIGFEQEPLAVLSKCRDLKQHNKAVTELLTQMHQYYEENKQETNHELEKLCNKVKTYMDENYMDSNIGVGALGEVFDITPSYLSKQFKDYTGISIPDYINTVRIKNAKNLLASADTNVSQVADLVGYLSSTVFIRIFKKYEGITPGAYSKIYGGLQ